MSDLLNELTVAKLLVHDATLQEALDGVFKAWDAVSEAVDGLEVEHLNRHSTEDEAVERLMESLREFDNQSDILHTAIAQNTQAHRGE